MADRVGKKKPIFVANWKLNKMIEEAIVFISETKRLVSNIDDKTIIIAPSFTVLCDVGISLLNSNIGLAGQDCFWEEAGAYTGEVSPGMLVDVGCSHVLIGHSERRQYFGETDETVNKKVKAALKAGLVVIVCIGETLIQREENETFAVLKKQVNVGLSDITEEQMKNVIIAYEPVWAIGTGKTATDQQAQEAHSYIRSLVAYLYGQAVGDEVHILYGGSVKPNNIKGLMDQPDIDGALVGGASLDVESFNAIVNFDS